MVFSRQVSASHCRLQVEISTINHDTYIIVGYCSDDTEEDNDNIKVR